MRVVAVFLFFTTIRIFVATYVNLHSFNELASTFNWHGTGYSSLSNQGHWATRFVTSYSGAVTAIQSGKRIASLFYVFVADFGALQSAYSLINQTTAAGSSRRTPRVAPELYVLCAEAALKVGLTLCRLGYHVSRTVDIFHTDCTEVISGEISWENICFLFYI